MKQNNNYYETQSLPLASTILCLGNPLESIAKSIDGKSIFIFYRTADLDKIIEAFWSRQLRIEPNSFWEAQRFLKSRIYGE